MTKRIGILFHTTEAQRETINKAAKTLDMDRSAMIRLAIAEYLQRHDIELPQDMQPHGYRKDYKDFSESE